MQPLRQKRGKQYMMAKLRSFELCNKKLKTHCRQERQVMIHSLGVFSVVLGTIVHVRHETTKEERRKTYIRS